MTDQTLEHRSPTLDFLGQLWSGGKVWFFSLLIVLILLLVNPEQASTSVRFALTNLLNTAPFLILSISLAAYAGATGADSLIARVFQGSPGRMILLAAIAGGLSPFCSCGVIPLIAALLAMGVPLSAVMAFWLASPIMDPSMFVLTTGVLGTEFAVVKTLTAIGLGLMGGAVVHTLSASGRLAFPLREGVGDGGAEFHKHRTTAADASDHFQPVGRSVIGIDFIAKRLKASNHHCWFCPFPQTQCRTASTSTHFFG